jgi:hypothetical protein
MISKILIANRGVVACRVIRSACPKWIASMGVVRNLWPSRPFVTPDVIRGPASIPRTLARMTAGCRIKSGMTEGLEAIA